VKPAPNLLVEHYRVAGAGNNGAFLVPCGRVQLRVIVSDELGWDHVSVSLPDRTPTWSEMCYVKDLFFMTTETAYQLHPPKTAYVDNHPYCLHLWRLQAATIPMPPPKMVGDKQCSAAEVRAMSPQQLAQLKRNLERRFQ